MWRLYCRDLESIKMKFTRLTKLEDFKKLKKKDEIVVIWNPDGEAWNGEMRGKKLYRIMTIQKATPRSPYPDEIILRKKGNIFFNFKMFLNGESKVVEGVFLISGKLSKVKKK